MTHAALRPRFLVGAATGVILSPSPSSLRTSPIASNSVGSEAMFENSASSSLRACISAGVKVFSFVPKILGR